MWEDYINVNPMDQITALALPVYFFSGEKDYNTPLQLVERYFETLHAPTGKQLVVFKKSAHTPFMAEAERFNQEMLRVKEETYH